jgi:hypothetical protein
MWLVGVVFLVLPVSTTAHYSGDNGGDVSITGTGDSCGPALYALLHKTVADDGTVHGRDDDCSARAGGRIAVALFAFTVAVPVAYASKIERPQ